jgi:hypothetical protein
MASHYSEPDYHVSQQHNALLVFVIEESSFSSPPRIGFEGIMRNAYRIQFESRLTSLMI